jgi:predicted nucleotidyltransferase
MHSLLPDYIVSILKDFDQKLRKTVQPTRIILYGSYAKGTWNDDSDIDIAVFINHNIYKLDDVFKQAIRICSQYEYDIQPQVFDDDEYYDPMGIVEEVVEYGVDIADIFSSCL